MKKPQYIDCTTDFGVIQSNMIFLIALSSKFTKAV